MDKHSFRLVSSGFHDCYYNMALDEALLESVAGKLDDGGQLGGEGRRPGANRRQLNADGERLPILRFFGWNPPAVSVGYFQGLTEEVDVEAAKRRGFDLVRRISGGGAVLHKSELTYSIIMPQDHPLAGKNLSESYRILCGGIIQSLAVLGVKAVFSGINDILVGGKKVSGNAQTRRLGCVLQHGTILLDNDVDIMFEVLKVPGEKIRGKLINEVKERVTSLHAVLGKTVAYEKAEAAFVSGFAEGLGLCLTQTGNTPEEEARAIELAGTKFSTREWLYKR